MFLNIVFRYGLFIPKKSDSNKVQLQHKPSIFGDDSDDEVIRISVISTVKKCTCSHNACMWKQVRNYGTDIRALDICYC